MNKPSPAFAFDITHRASTSGARCGLLHTPHGTLPTPNFIFCATKASIKGVTTEQVRAAGADILLANTYHLLLQPGPETVAAHGGLHRMMQWSGPMLTDSGGFQIFSLGHGGVAHEIKGTRQKATPRTLLNIDEEGATFRAYTDGTLHHLTPELSIQTQRQLGADLILVLDECTPYHSSRDYTARSMHRSHRWATRSLHEFQRHDHHTQALYGIVQGGIYPDLRQESAQFTGSQPFFGQAIGGSLGAEKAQMRDVIAMTTPHLPSDRPTHLLGIGGIEDLWHCVEYGIDTFDCVHPTRLARHGGALVRPALNDGHEHLNLRNARFRNDLTPLDPTSPFSFSHAYSRAYLHHLLKAGETLAGVILTLHNIHFMTTLAASLRRAIQEDRLDQTRREWLGR